MISLIGKTPKELADEWSLSPPFRAKQLFKNLYSGIMNFDEMSDLPKTLRETLKANGTFFSAELLRERVSADGTVKRTLRFPDGAVIEAVVLTTDKGRKTACLSTQVGCAMGCRFCQSEPD